MPVRYFSIAILCSAAVICLTTAPAFAKKKISYENSVRLSCLKQVGAYYNPGRQRWIIYGGRNSAHNQAFYNCIDSHTMGRR